jgi:hypothetical protein
MRTSSRVLSLVLENWQLRRSNSQKARLPTTVVGGVAKTMTALSDSIHMRCTRRLKETVDSLSKSKPGHMDNFEMLSKKWVRRKPTAESFSMGLTGWGPNRAHLGLSPVLATNSPGTQTQKT